MKQSEYERALPKVSLIKCRDNNWKRDSYLSKMWQKGVAKIVIFEK